MASFHLGVVVVTYNAGDVIADCLESLLAAATADGVTLHVALVDNVSTDDTQAQVAAWESGAVPYRAPDDLPVTLMPVPKPITGHRITHLSPGFNAGFAGGVNCGLRHLAQDRALDRFWVLNPDSIVPPGTVRAFASHDAGPFSLMGGRVIYARPSDRVQIDGGYIRRRSGVTGNVNQMKPVAQTQAPRADEIDFITGASMVASRAFYEQVGPMAEEYFLYYEEVDWALQRGPDLPLAVCPDALVYHVGGTAIGSGTMVQRDSPFALFFRHRSRMMFVRKFLRGSLLSAWVFTFAKAAQILLRGDPAGAGAVLRGASDGVPPQMVMDRLSPEAAAVALSSRGQAAYARARKA